MFYSPSSDLDSSLTIVRNDRLRGINLSPSKCFNTTGLPPSPDTLNQQLSKEFNSWLS